MKKLVIVTLTDGSVITRDLDTAISVGMKDPKLSIRDFGKANSPFFILVMQEMASGFLHYESANDRYSRFIPPSQIKSVEVVFTESETKMGVSKS